jgi:multiple sugar transport system permease protein
LAHIALIALSIPFILPLIWMITTSLKTDSQIFMTGGNSTSAFSLQSILPHPVKWSNYADAIHAVPFGTYLGNTLMLCLLNVVAAVFMSALVAYGFARLKFKGKDVLFFIMISTMALPQEVTMVPVFSMFRMVGWYGTFLPLIVPYLAGNALFIFLLKQFFQTIPEELAEAARIDGASEFRIWWQIMLPLARPALATVALFQFLYTWNDFFGPLLYLNDPSKYTLAYGLQQLMASYGGDSSGYAGNWAQLMAGSCIFTVPIIILFFLAQRTFIQGIATTGGKN